MLYKVFLTFGLSYWSVLSRSDYVCKRWNSIEIEIVSSKFHSPEWNFKSLFDLTEDLSVGLAELQKKTQKLTVFYQTETTCCFFVCLFVCFQPIRRKIKTNLDLDCHFFPRLISDVCFPALSTGWMSLLRDLIGSLRYSSLNWFGLRNLCNMLLTNQSESDVFACPANQMQNRTTRLLKGTILPRIGDAIFFKNCRVASARRKSRVKSHHRTSDATAKKIQKKATGNSVSWFFMTEASFDQNLSPWVATTLCWRRDSFGENRNACARKNPLVYLLL